MKTALFFVDLFNSLFYRSKCNKELFLVNGETSLSDKLALFNQEQSPDKSEKKSYSEESNLDTSLSNGNLSTSSSFNQSIYNGHFIPSFLLQQTANQKSSLASNTTSSPSSTESSALDAAAMVSLIQHHQQQQQEENLLKTNPSSLLTTAHFLADFGQSVSTHLHNHLQQQQNLSTLAQQCTTLPTMTNSIINSITDVTNTNHNHLAHHISQHSNPLSATHPNKFNSQHELLLVEHMQRQAAAQMVAVATAVSSHRRRKARTVFSDMQLHGLEKRLI